MHLTFLGAAGSVTGSKYLLETNGRRIMVDCGLFQGFKELRQRNWDPLPISPRNIDVVVLTHAHLDHTGYLPLLVRNGFAGKIICTSGTSDLCKILLPDSGRLQEQDADFANRRGFSKHETAQPLYTEADALKALSLFDGGGYNAPRDLGGGATATFRNAGHILGAATVAIAAEGRTILFSGDLGRPNDPVLLPPDPAAEADYLLVESTYGDRKHDTRDPAVVLAEVVNRTVKRGGTIVIPAFAVGRVQSVLFYLQRLKATSAIPDVPIFLDSPMAIDATEMLIAHCGEHRLTPEQCREMHGVARQTRSVEESKAIDRSRVPSIIVSSSGMATGGRVLHHLAVFAPDPNSTVLFTGYQAGGTRGALMVAGAKQIKMHGGMVPVRAEVLNLGMLSAHADADEIIAWLKNFIKPPRQTFVIHGEASGSDTLRMRIAGELKWQARVPSYREEVELA
jgi:metallo-beta-lactamase family protein